MEQNILDISLERYSASIQKLQANLNKLDSQSEEYVRTLTQLKTLQNQFNEALEKGDQDVMSSAGIVQQYKDKIDNLNKSLESTHGFMTNFNTVMQGVGNLSQALGVNIGGVTKAIGIYNTSTQAATVMTETFGMTAKVHGLVLVLARLYWQQLEPLNFYLMLPKKMNRLPMI